MSQPIMSIPCLRRAILLIRDGRPARIAAVALAMAACLSLGACKAKLTHPEYLQLYSVTASSDQTHAIAASDPDGETWYREPKPILDLSHLDYANARVIEVPANPEYPVAIDLNIKEPYQQSLDSWLAKHMDQNIAFLIDGRLLRVMEVKSTAGSRVLISGFKTEPEASRIAEAIRSGGVAR